jgi:hypothetical protein
MLAAAQLSSKPAFRCWEVSDTASPRPERTAANNQKVWASQVHYNFHVSARTQQDDMHHRSILTTRMKKQEEEGGALIRVSTSPSSTELPRINHN